MTTILGLRIRHLSFLGPNRAPAIVQFGPGFNVLYGASDTGKSFVVDAIDFIPEDQQVIIVENTDPPADVQSLPQAIKFTSNPGDGRAGLFVIEKANPGTPAS
jgi:hypothetical protein